MSKVSMPNNVLKSMILFTLCFMFNIQCVATEISVTSAKNERASVEDVLNRLHLYAANAQGDDYFQLFTQDALYIGTDATETWTIPEFKEFAMPYFSKGKGWTYVPRQRTIKLSSDKQYAWFVELLDNQKYGVSRGTGVLIKINDAWKIAQYHLTFPIPNSLAQSITAQIKANKQ